MGIPEFIAVCDRFCEEFGVSRVWLSKRLFSDTFRIDSLAAEKSDVGVRRLEKAVADLAALRLERSQHHGGASSPSPSSPVEVMSAEAST